MYRENKTKMNARVNMYRDNDINESVGTKLMKSVKLAVSHSESEHTKLLPSKTCKSQEGINVNSTL